MSITKVQPGHSSPADKRPPSNYGACSAPPSSSAAPCCTDKPLAPPADAAAQHEGPLRHALHSLLTHFADAPEYNQDNPDILTGYRRPTASWAECLATVGGWHNESVNIHSHLWPAVVAACLLVSGGLTFANYFELLTPPGFELGRQGWRAIATPIYPFWTPELPTVGSADTLVFAVFFLGAFSCFGASALFHTSLCHTEEVVARTRRLDFLGIFLMGNACFLPSFHYGFFCDPSLRNFYAATMTAACFTGIYIVCLSEAFQTAEYRRLRTATFVVVGSTSVVPFGHAVVRYGWSEASASMGFGWIAIEMACYTIGAILYSERCPERFRPGAFDYVGSSHQLFHVLAVLGVAAQYASAGEGFRFRHGELGGLCGM